MDDVLDNLTHSIHDLGVVLQSSSTLFHVIGVGGPELDSAVCVDHGMGFIGDVTDDVMIANEIKQNRERN